MCELFVAIDRRPGELGDLAPKLKKRQPGTTIPGGLMKQQLKTVAVDSVYCLCQFLSQSSMWRYRLAENLHFAAVVHNICCSATK